MNFIKMNKVIASKMMNNFRSGRGDEYPNSWRLSSIYQQAYKPVESRKRPFLQSIYR